MHDIHLYAFIIDCFHGINHLFIHKQMRVAVINNYDSDYYKVFLQIVKIAKPEENILDLSKYNSRNYNKNKSDRHLEIDSAHQVIIGNNWLENIDARDDITFAMSQKKDIYAYVDGRFYPWDEYCAKR